MVFLMKSAVCFFLSVLSVDAHISNPTLSDVKAEFMVRYPEIRALIPDINGTSGNVTMCRGNDMFDGGDFLATEYGSDIESTGGTIKHSTAFGPHGHYATIKVDEFFFLAAVLDGVYYFRVISDYGADGEGDAIVRTFEYKGMKCKLLQICMNEDATVNKLICVENNENIRFDVDTSTEAGYIEAYELDQGNKRLYYLLYSSTDGLMHSASESESIAQKFVDIIFDAVPASG